MSNPISSILAAVNRDKNRPLNILTINHNEGYQCALAKTEHNFFFLQHPQLRSWSTDIRPKPDNCFLLQDPDINKQIKKDMVIDLILCQNRSHHYQILSQVAMQLNCPILDIEYSLSSPSANPYYIESLSYQLYNANIFNSEFTANSWGFDIDDDDCYVIPHGIDNEIFNKWTGGNGKILTVCKNFKNREEDMGFSIFNEVVNKVNAPDIFQHINGNKPFHELLSAYRKCDVFLNTSQWHACPMALLEAMCVGCPVVSKSTTILSDIIDDGINGLIADTPDEIIEKINNIMDDKNLANKLSENAVETILEKFNLNIFKDKWNNIFMKYIGSASCFGE